MDKLKNIPKYSQKDLRRLMLEKKSKLNSQKNSERIESPIAKYDSSGNLTCIICRTTIKSAGVWKVHVNSKQHKQKVDAAKEIKDQLLQAPAARQGPRSSTGENREQKKDVPKIKSLSQEDTIGNVASTTTAEVKQNTDVPAAEIAENLPEHFFDDPMKDAKARNTEYRDPQDEEWERFQKEIKEESLLSNAIVAGEQDETAVDRQIKEIDEQIEHWSKVILLEKKKTELIGSTKKSAPSRHEDSMDDSGDSNDEFEEFSDWRSKAFHR